VGDGFGERREAAADVVEAGAGDRRRTGGMSDWRMLGG
jgi:hypothetical protein